MTLQITNNVPLAEHTTFRIGGPARYFVSIHTINDLREAISFAKRENIPWKVLGGGSNVLIADNGFNGLVLHMHMQGISYKESSDAVHVTVGAGESWDTLVAQTVARGLYGLENLSAIPGTVGTSPIQNIGAYGAQASDTITSVTVFDTEKNETRTLAPKECNFEYRDSIFKHSEGKHLVITHVTFALTKNGMLITSYRDVEEYFSHRDETPTLLSVREAITHIRSKKFPDLSKVGTAGSFFKNPIISKEQYEQMTLQYPSLPAYTVNDTAVKIPIAWIFDNVYTLNGTRYGDVCFFQSQPLVVVNCGNATADDIIAVTQNIAQRVQKDFNITLETEVQYVCT